MSNMNDNKVNEINGQQGTGVDSRNLVHDDQQSMFDTADAFSESMVVEKAEVKVDSSEETPKDVPEEKTAEGSKEKLGDTAVFTFAKDRPEGSEIEHEELSVGELQDSAKQYYNATHSESIENKVDELRRFADDVLEDEAEAERSEKDGLKEQKRLEKEKKLEKKKRRKGIVSDDDIAMLTGVFEPVGKTDTVKEVFEEKKTEKAASDNDVSVTREVEKTGVYDEKTGSTEYTNPLGTEMGTEETEEEKLMKALGGQSKHYKTFESVFGNDEPDAEYTDRNEEPIILKGLRSRAIVSAVCAFLTLIVSVFCIYFEAVAGTKAAHPAFLEPGKYGVTYALVMLQLMFVGIMLNLDGVKRAFKGLRPAKASVEGFTAAALVVCTLHTVLSCITVPDSPELRTYCSVGCISLVLLSLNSFAKSYTALTSFCVAASKAPKTAAFGLDRNSLEAKQFEKYLDDDSTVITAGKGSFVGGFFKKSYAVPSSGLGTFRMIIAVVVVALGAAVIKGVLSKSLYGAVCTFTGVSLAALPANALISTALPFLLASFKAKRSQTAFIGEAACDAYENCAVVSFDDVEVFSPKNVKVSSIRTYGDNRIDKVILYMARIFDKLEGPLSYVFSNSVQNVENGNLDAQIVEHFSDGLSVKVDGKDILVGTDAFMKLYDIETTTDNIDESFIGSLGSIMYMSVDGQLAAKFYIKYTVNRGFEAVLRSFYDAGICVGIRTLDPCITTELILSNLKGTNYPVSVIKTCAGQKSVPAENVDSTIISLSGIHNFLKGFIRLDHLRNVYRTNTVISTVSLIAGLILSVVMGLVGETGIGIMFVALFQLLWCLPTVLISVFSK